MNVTFRLGLRSLKRNLLRHRATLGAVAFGISGLLCLFGYINRWEQTLTVTSIYLDGAGMLSVYKKDGLKMHLTSPKKYSLNRKEQQSIIAVSSQVPGFLSAHKTLKGVALVGNGRVSMPAFVRAYEPAFDAAIRLDPTVIQWAGKFLPFKKGVGFSPNEDRPEIGLTPALARLLNKSSTFDESQQDAEVQIFGSRFDGSFNALDAKIAHFYSTGNIMTEETRATVPLSLLQNLYDTDRVSYVSLYFDSKTNLERAKKTLEERFLAQGIDADVHLWSEEAISPLYAGVMNFLKTMALFLSILIVSVIVLAVVNATSMTLMERASEIGTLRSMGYSKALISRMLGVEGIFLGLVSSALGLCLGALICFSVNAFEFQFRPPGFAGNITFLLKPGIIHFASVGLFGTFIVGVTSYFSSMFLLRAKIIQLLGVQFS